MRIKGVTGGQLRFTAARIVLLEVALAGTVCFQPTGLWSVKQVTQVISSLNGTMHFALRTIVENGLDGKSMLRIDLEEDLLLSMLVARQVKASKLCYNIRNSARH